MRTATKLVQSVEDPAALQALAHPLRVRILEELRSSASAAEVARALGQGRQNVNYHLKELDRAGLVRRVGERRNRNFVESLYRSVARTFVVSPRVAWGNPRRVRAMREQLSLETLVHLGERLERDAVALLDRAAFEGEEVASSSVEVEIRLAGEEDRARFLKEYLAAVRPVIERHQRAEGDRYRVVLAAYPDPNRRRRPEVNNPARPGHRPPPPPLGPARSASDLPEPDLNQSRV